MVRKWIVLIAIVVLTLAVVGCTKEASNEQNVEAVNNDLVRSNTEGEVQMGVIFANPLGQGKEGYLTFVVQMDNHSYDLDEYDLSEYAVLVDDQGNSPKGVGVWETDSGGGHHVISYLLFPENNFITSDTEYINLTIKDFIDVPERVFIWEKDALENIVEGK